MGEITKLNLGSNDLTYPGFTNVDIRYIPGALIDDVSKLNSIASNSIEEIKAEAILEHFAPDKTAEIVKLWVSKLKDGGKIMIMVPDGELIFDRYLHDKNWDRLVHSMFGNMELMRQWHGDNAERYMHHTLFSKALLERQMQEAGLKDIKETSARHGDCFSLEGIK